MHSELILKSSYQASIGNSLNPMGPTGIISEMLYPTGPPGAEGTFPMDKLRERLFWDFHRSHSIRHCRLQ